MLPAVALLADATPLAEMKLGLLPGLGVLLGAAAVLWILTRVVVGGLAIRIVAATKSEWDDALVQHGFTGALALFAPVMALHGAASLPGWGDDPATTQAALWLTNLSNALVALVSIRLIGTLTRGLGAVYSKRAPGVPVGAYLQLINLIATIAGVLSALALLFGHSPWAFLSGLGAMTAVLVLVFRDTILALVASIQFGAADMLRVGDWVEIPSMGADGDVVEITLQTVKVRNFDKTTTMVPTARFLDLAFKNWRTMPESGGRRIKTALPVDAASVRPLTEAEINALLKDEMLPEGRVGDNDAINLTEFVRYAANALKTSSLVNPELTSMARVLDPSAVGGVPVELYCYTRDTDWVAHEAARTALVGKLLAAMARFGLRPLQLDEEGAASA